eukprot:Em0014g256a
MQCWLGLLIGEVGEAVGAVVQPTMSAVSISNDPGQSHKIMSEVFLTRLLATKRILQPYVDDLIKAVFSVSSDKPIPKAVKYLFDFLDLQAADMGISDPDVLHTWKTNSTSSTGSSEIMWKEGAPSSPEAARPVLLAVGKDLLNKLIPPVDAEICSLQTKGVKVVISDQEYSLGIEFLNDENDACLAEQIVEGFEIGEVDIDSLKALYEDLEVDGVVQSCRGDYDFRHGLILFLRFWVNVIKNPDFVFDIHKSATVDSCLSVISQAYIDACSTSETKYTKDTPSAKLLYVNEVKQYKNQIRRFYNTVQSSPKLDNQEMDEYFRTAVQPAQALFSTDAALYELFKYAVQYSDCIIAALRENDLGDQASSFQSIAERLK